MTNQELEKEVARLESINDHLKTELEYLDELLKRSGFTNGLTSLREVAEEMIESGEIDREFEA